MMILRSHKIRMHGKVNSIKIVKIFAGTQISFLLTLYCARKCARTYKWGRKRSRRLLFLPPSTQTGEKDRATSEVLWPLLADSTLPSLRQKHAMPNSRNSNIKKSETQLLKTSWCPVDCHASSIFRWVSLDQPQHLTRQTLSDRQPATNEVN